MGTTGSECTDDGPYYEDRTSFFLRPNKSADLGRVETCDAGYVQFPNGFIGAWIFVSQIPIGNLELIGLKRLDIGVPVSFLGLCDMGRCRRRCLRWPLLRSRAFVVCSRSEPLYFLLK